MVTTVNKQDDPERAHLADIEDGCGCAEIWEHLSDGREKVAAE
jgi:hypothetical protein